MSNDSLKLAITKVVERWLYRTFAVLFLIIGMGVSLVLMRMSKRYAEAAGSLTAEWTTSIPEGATAHEAANELASLITGTGGLILMGVVVGTSLILSHVRSKSRKHES